MRSDVTSNTLTLSLLYQIQTQVVEAVGNLTAWKATLADLKVRLP